MDDSSKVSGGVARAAALSPEQRAAIARDAANKRWGNDIPAEGLPIAAIGADLDLAGIQIPCAVLPGGIRVLSERGIAKGLGRTRSGSHWEKKRDQGAKLPLYLTAKNLEPFIPNELAKALSEPIWYRSAHGGRPVAGVPAECITDICGVWIDASAAGVLTKPQLRIAAQAQALLRSFAKVGIIALVDEATGYQEFRERNELQTILRAYVSEEFLPWTQKFPMEFFKEMFRLWGWEWPSGRGGPIGPRYASKLINILIYDQLPEGVAEELKRRAPANEKWQRKERLHQSLTGEIGQKHLDRQVAVSTTLMNVCDTKEEFMEKFERRFKGSFPKARQRSFDLPVRRGQGDA